MRENIAQPAKTRGRPANDDSSLGQAVQQVMEHWGIEQDEAVQRVAAWVAIAEGLTVKRARQRVRKALGRTK
jgi:hypothetical protein